MRDIISSKDNESQSIFPPSHLGEGRGGGLDFHRANSDLYPLLKQHAKRMRANPTKAEEVMWQLLKNDSFGVSFKRQCVILDFIADFFAPTLDLIIEIDGEYHNEEEQMILDEARTHRLKNKGYNIIRFTNDEVLCHTEYVIRIIEDYISQKQKD